MIALRARRRYSILCCPAVHSCASLHCTVCLTAAIGGGPLFFSFFFFVFWYLLTRPFILSFLAPNCQHAQPILLGPRAVGIYTSPQTHWRWTSNVKVCIRGTIKGTQRKDRRQIILVGVRRRWAAIVAAAAWGAPAGFNIWHVATRGASRSTTAPTHAQSARSVCPHRLPAPSARTVSPHRLPTPSARPHSQPPPHGCAASPPIFPIPPTLCAPHAY